MASQGKLKMKPKAKDRDRRITIKWSSDEVMKMIAAVEAEACLWNVASLDYKNRDAKETSWSQIAELLKVDKKEVIVKWNNLRNTYRTSMKAILTKSDQDLISRKSSLPFYEAMSFLQPTMFSKSEVHTASYEPPLSLSDASVDIKYEALSDQASTSCSPVPKETTFEYVEASEDIQYDAMSDDNGASTSTPVPKRRRRENHPTKETLMKSIFNAINYATKIPENDVWSDVSHMLMLRGRQLQGEHPDLALKLRMGVTKVLDQIDQEELARKLRKNASHYA